MPAHSFSRIQTLANAAEKAAESMQNKPIIGISVNVRENLNCVAEGYIQSVLLAGGLPLLIPVMEQAEDLLQLIQQLDGLILSGGGDIDPSFFNETPQASPASINEKRDEFDILLIHLASEKQIPILGICRGIQVLNVAFGGNIYQDIASHYPHTALEHEQDTDRHFPWHSLTVSENSWLHRCTGKLQLDVNSIHHQAIKEVAPVFAVSARSTDGIVEAIESNQCAPIWGVQFHPEAMATHQNIDMLAIFQFFIGRAAYFRQAKQIHQSIISLDSHCDTPMFFPQGIDIAKRTSIVVQDHSQEVICTRVSLPKMKEGYLDACCMVAYLPQGERNEEGYQQAYAQAKATLLQLKEQVLAQPQLAGLAQNSAQIRELKKQGKRAILLGIENAYALGNSLQKLSYFKDLGVVYITLCHNGNNDFCDSVSGPAEFHGLSPLGVQLIQEMNQLGILIDVSHASDATVSEVLRYSKVPIVASHSSVQSICNHRRNLSDKLLKQIAQCGGVVQICVYEGFLTKNPPATVYDVVQHIDYAVRIMGIDHVGLGSDFDGGGGVLGLNAANEMINLTVALLEKGYSQESLQKLWGGNFMRVLDAVQNK